MEKLQNNLKTIIDKGVTLSKKEVNRSYLFSSFKRTVSSWNSDFKKAKDDKKLNKLMETMQKDAKKYLDETKNMFGNDLVKNPKLYNKINEAKKNIDNMTNFFNYANKKYFDFRNNILDHTNEIVTKYSYIHNYTKELLQKNNNYNENTLFDAIIAKVNNDHPSDSFHLNSNITSDYAKTILFAQKYGHLSTFETWLDDEINYVDLLNSGEMTLKQLIAYAEHDAYIEEFADSKISNLNTIQADMKTCCKKLPKDYLKKILKKIGAAGKKIALKLFNTLLGLLLLALLSPLIIIIALIFLPFTLLGIAAMPFNIANKIKNKIENIKESIKELINKLSCNRPIKDVLDSLSEKAKKYLETLKVKNEDKQQHGTNKVNYMKKITKLSSDTVEKIAKDIQNDTNQ